MQQASGQGQSRLSSATIDGGNIWMSAYLRKCIANVSFSPWYCESTSPWPVVVRMYPLPKETTVWIRALGADVLWHKLTFFRRCHKDSGTPRICMGRRSYQHIPSQFCGLVAMTSLDKHPRSQGHNVNEDLHEKSVCYAFSSSLLK